MKIKRVVEDEGEDEDEAEDNDNDVEVLCGRYERNDIRPRAEREDELKNGREGVGKGGRRMLQTKIKMILFQRLTCFWLTVE